MDDRNEQTNPSCAVDADGISDDRGKLLQMVLALTEEVKRLSERVAELEQTPRQSHCILCPSIRIHIPIHIPFGCVTKRD